MTEDDKNKQLTASPIANSIEDILANSPEGVLANRKQAFPLIRIVIGMVVAILVVVGAGVGIVFSALDKEAAEKSQWAAENPYRTCKTFEGKTYTLPVEKTMVAPDDYYQKFELTVHNVTYNIPNDQDMAYDCEKGTALEVTINNIGDPEDKYDGYGISTTSLRLYQDNNEIDNFSSDYKFSDYINKNELRMIGGSSVGEGISTRGWIIFGSDDQVESNKNVVLKFNTYSTRYNFVDIELPAND